MIRYIVGLGVGIVVGSYVESYLRGELDEPNGGETSERTDTE